MEKILQANKNNVGGYDLYTERDSGNRILCLTGRYTNSLEYWKKMQALAEEVVHFLENVNEKNHPPTITVNMNS
jgi:hypothetical protein